MKKTEKKEKRFKKNLWKIDYYVWWIKLKKWKKRKMNLSIQKKEKQVQAGAKKEDKENKSEKGGGNEFWIPNFLTSY